jgi:DNA-binding LacI/PurR family transcriptional regulator
MMEHLLTNCRSGRVFFVGGVRTNIDTQARFTAYRDALKMAGIPFHDDDVYHLDFTYESAYRLGIEKAQEWAGPKQHVFAANDEMAAGIIAGATAQGVI